MTTATALDKLIQRKAELEQSTTELAQVTEDIAVTEKQIVAADRRRTGALNRASRLEHDAEHARYALGRAAAIPAEDTAADARIHFGDIASTVSATSIDECAEHGDA